MKKLINIIMSPYFLYLLAVIAIAAFVIQILFALDIGFDIMAIIMLVCGVLVPLYFLYKLIKKKLPWLFKK